MLEREKISKYKEVIISWDLKQYFYISNIINKLNKFFGFIR